MEQCLKSDEKDPSPVSSLDEFVRRVMSWSESVIFRGQTKREGWPLVPSAGRDSDRSLIPWDGHEHKVLEEFERESIPYLDHLPANDWQWLALAQHNRLPTRLLDWTKNPLVALWFAVKDPPVDCCPGLVWALYYTDLRAVSNTKDLKGSPFDIECTHLYFPEHMYPSIQAQSSVFTVHPCEKNSNPARFPPLGESINDSDLILRNIEVSAESFSIIRYQLFRVGISPASLFPGLQGIVDKIRYENIRCQDEGRDGHEHSQSHT